jgi:hypothetical protein
MIVYDPTFDHVVVHIEGVSSNGTHNKLQGNDRLVVRYCPSSS